MREGRPVGVRGGGRGGCRGGVHLEGSYCANISTDRGMVEKVAGLTE